MTLNALIVLPGRGSFRPEHLGTLPESSPIVAHANEFRKQLGRKTVSELANAKKFTAKNHIAGENASILTAVYSLAELEQLKDDVNVVAICGNSMGWYTTLIASGALTPQDGLLLIETMGQFQASNQIGAQLLYPMINPDWTLDDKSFDLINQLVHDKHDLYWSIRLGHQAVLGGSKSTIKEVQKLLPTVQIGSIEFPLTLPMHSAFHTPLMSQSSERACQELNALSFNSPKIPIFDGFGQHWRPHTTDPQKLKTYTLTAQVTEPFNFKSMIQAAVQEYAPDCIIQLGPGGNLGGAIAHSLIEISWSRIHNKSDFLSRQDSSPYLYSTARLEQRNRVLKC